MRSFKNAEEYYDALFERDRRNAGWRVVLRYLLSVLTFLVFMTVALTGYWTWEDYVESGYTGITFESFKRHAIFRWEEFRQGRIGLD